MYCQPGHNVELGPSKSLMMEKSSDPLQISSCFVLTLFFIFLMFLHVIWAVDIRIELRNLPWPLLVTHVAFALINSISNINVAVIQGDIPLQGDFSAEHMIFGGGFSNSVFFVMKCDHISIFFKISKNHEKK